MSETNIGTCRGCKKRIRWVRTKKGKLMPCDPETVFIIESYKGDTIVITEDGDTIRGIKTSARIGKEIQKGWVSHFATCTQAGKFKK